MNNLKNDKLKMKNGHFDEQMTCLWPNAKLNDNEIIIKQIMTYLKRTWWMKNMNF